MQVNLPPVIDGATTVLGGEISAEVSLPELTEGESFEARVIFSDRGTVHLKTAEGAFIRARLEGGVVLAEGSEVSLTIVEKGDGLIKLRLSGPLAGESAVPGSVSTAGRMPALPPALAAIVEQMQNSALKPHQRLEVFMRALGDFPALSTDNAAIRQTAALLLTDGRETAQAAPLPGTEAAPGQAQQASALPGQMLSELNALLAMDTHALATAAAKPAGETAPGILAPLFELFMPELTADVPQTAPDITAALPEQNLPAQASEEQAPPSQAAPETELPVPAQPEQALPALAAQGRAAAVAAQTVAQEAPRAGVAQKAAQAAPEAPQATISGLPDAEHLPPQAQETPAAKQAPDMGLATAAAHSQKSAEQTVTVISAHSQKNGEQPATVLSSLPTATRRELLEFTQRLVAELFPEGTKAASQKDLIAFAERLFINTGGPAAKNAPALRQAARELETRLELLKETVARSSLPQKEELLQQVNRLLQHNDTLREERPLILQLPVFFGEQRQTAELYVYRREKGSRKLDPRNATILLALNTEHLGRMEALIQVQQKDIHLKLEIGRAGAVPFIREQSRALTGLLSEAGYRLASATVQQLIRQAGPETADRTLEEFRRDFGNKVDIQV
ncbi:MAG: flagellar hook-length control protein FliK [Clostridiales bacterium]|nr:flagellar hook-length control protein FliK [Clostridiales bacterium]